MAIYVIKENKRSKLSSYAEAILRAGGKLMQCLDELESEDESEMGERVYGRYGMRGGMRHRYEDNPDWDMDERRGVPGTGRTWR